MGYRLKGNVENSANSRLGCKPISASFICSQLTRVPAIWATGCHGDFCDQR